MPAESDTPTGEPNTEQPLSQFLDDLLIGGHDLTDDQLADLLEAKARDLRRARSEPSVCGRIMVGSGTDTYDPVCELPGGHGGSCKSSAAIDQHRLLGSTCS